MTLEPGRTLAHYEVVELIGKGGMGEVYRARDKKLGREVAIKILPEEFASDADRLARFSREARILASLNHPNIAAIYGLEETGSLHYLVLELVPGETLAERIARGAIPLEEALDLALEIAGALHAAHARGVVHRDLKPANIKLTPDGGVKVLDFGLAKALEASADDEEGSLSLSPTLTRDATRVGVILGTAAYMSPEQAKGKPVDERADLWALGAVLFEMLTGRRPFAGDDVSDTLAAVLRVEPEWDALPEETPAPIRWLLRRSLMKNPKQRLEDASNFRFAIEQARAEPEAGTRADAETRGERRSRARDLVAIAVGFIAGLVLLSVVLRGSDPGAAPRVTVHPQFVPSGVSVREVALSRDGGRIAFVGTPEGGPSRVYLRSLDASEAEPLVGTEGAQSLDFSPDGEWLVFYEGRSFYKMSLGGGAPVKLFDNTLGAPVAWGAGDDIVFASFLGGLMRGKASGEDPEPLTTPDRAAGEYLHRQPRFLPDGKVVLFEVVKNYTEPWVGLASLGAEPSTHRIVVEGSDPKFSRKSGHLLVQRGTALWAAGFDAERLELVSEPVPVLEGVSWYDIADDGSLLYTPSRGPARQRTLVWVDRHGTETPLPAPPRLYSSPNIAPDGRRIALDVELEENFDIAVWDVEREILSRVTRHPALELSPVFSPDGRRLAFHSSRDGSGVYVVPADASAEPTAVWRGDALVFPSQWAETPEDLFASVLYERVMFVARLPLEGQVDIPEPLRRSSFFQAQPALSPDGRWIAYGSTDLDDLNIYVRPYPDVERGRWQVSRDGGQEPQWSSDGNELFFRSRTHMMAAAVEVSERNGEETFSASAPSPLFPLLDYFRPTAPQTYDVAPDGRFVMVKWVPRSSEASDSAPMVLIENWAEGLAPDPR